MSEILLYPPVIFLVSFLAVWLFSALTRGLAPKPHNAPGSGKLEPYACGEDYKEEKIEPDYGMFFPFAIFFTVLHVAGLMIATLAGADMTIVIAALAAVYVLSVLLVLGILYAD
jgi:NADH-quinone oxidoreductase subunit A